MTEISELIDIFEYFRLDEGKYICLVPDCKSQIKTLKKSALHRHFQHCHPTKLKTVIPLKKNLLNLEIHRKEILFICVEHVTACGRTLNSIEDSSFKKLLNFQLKVLKGTPHELTISEIKSQLRSLINVTANEVRLEIKNEFSNKYYAIMFDLATKRNRAVLGIDIQTIHLGKVVNRSIGMQRITSKHTGKNIADMVLDRLTEFAISAKLLVGATVDNARNVIKAVRLMDSEMSETIDEDDPSDSDNDDMDSIENYWLEPEFQRHLLTEAAKEFCSEHKPYVYDKIDCMRCASHTLQLAVDDALEKTNCSVVIEKARTLVKNLKLQSIVLKLEEASLPFPSIDCTTRWFSTYVMVRIYTKYTSFIIQIHSVYNDNVVSCSMCILFSVVYFVEV